MGLLNLARQGRNGDTRVAHLTPGEVVIPREVAAVRPDLVRGIGQQYSQMGGNPNTLKVGQGNINPRTGIEEFATEQEVRDMYHSVLGRGVESQAALNNWMAQDNLSGFAAAAAPELANRAAATPATSGGGSSATPSGGGGSTAAPATDWTAAVNQGYRDLFGREGETKGVNDWVTAAGQGKFANNDALWSAMKASARNDDILAMNDGAKYNTAWRSDINQNTDHLSYDATLDKWNPIKKITPENPGGLTYAPQFNSQVDANVETIEGRIKNLLDANNPVIRQAGDRAMAQFAQRGLMNSSMAIEAANEAMTSKAIEIAGPDAQRYFTNRRENVDWNNKFSQADQNHQYDLENQKVNANINQDTYAKNAEVSQKNALQQNYLSYVAQANDVMAKSIQAIQSADMTPDAKTSQIAEIQMVFGNALTTYKETFKNMPGWRDEWAALAPTIGG